MINIFIRKRLYIGKISKKTFTRYECLYYFACLEKNIFFRIMHLASIDIIILLLFY